jgi:hypothetical protein
MQQRPPNQRSAKPPQNLLGMPSYQFSNSAADLNTKHSFQTQTVSDRLDNQLSQSIALILLDKNYEQIESNALYALTHLMKDYLLEIGTEIK